MKNKIEIGQRYGKLVVIERVEDFDGLSDSRPQWLCKCDCGKEVKKVNRYLTRSMTPHCGCNAKSQKLYS